MELCINDVVLCLPSAWVQTVLVTCRHFSLVVVPTPFTVTGLHCGDPSFGTHTSAVTRSYWGEKHFKYHNFQFGNQ